MSKRANRTSRSAQNRKRKRREALRAKAGSPYRLAGQFGETVAAYMNKNWKDEGMASIHVLRRVPGRGHASASFLVDTWCIGLKDAWGRLGISADEFRENIIDRVPEELELVRVKLDVVKRIVGGGIRFARDNGFRLPPRYQRWTALLGEFPVEESSDLSDFGCDGRLRYVGTHDDLKKRLIGCTVEEFLRREDVEFIIEEEPEITADEASESIQEATVSVRERMVRAVRQWCFANGIAPHRRLPDACDLIVEAIMQSSEFEDDALLDEAEMIRIDRGVEALLALEQPAARSELQPALEQLQRFMQQFAAPQELSAALGLDDEPE